MGTIAEKLSRLSQTKTEIKAAIVAKGVAVADADAFSTYPNKIAAIQTGGAPEEPAVWKPCADWIDIRENVPANGISLLVCDLAYRTPAFICNTSSGTYAVDWGDGSPIENFASGARAQHTYVKGAGQPCLRGYTTFRINITSPNLTRFYVTRSSVNSSSPENWGLLWAIINAPTLTTLSNAFYSGNSVMASMLEHCTICDLPACTDMGQDFRGCSSLKEVIAGNMASLTSLYFAFLDCVTIDHIAIGNCPQLTGAATVFNSCRTLIRVDLGQTPLLRDFTNVQNANSLRALVFDGCNFAAGAAAPIALNFSGLDAAALNALFTSLDTVTGKTITVTGSVGASSCDTSIATAKGWTVVI